MNNKFRHVRIRRNDDSGFGSYILTTMDMVRNCWMNGLIPYIDYRTGFNSYRTFEQENVWDTFFEQPERLTQSEIKKTLIEYHGDPRLLSFDEKLMHFPITFHKRGEEGILVDGLDAFKAIRFQPHIVSFVESELECNRCDNFDLLYFRGTDKSKEQGEPELSRYIELLKTNKTSETLFVQTDDYRFIKFCREQGLEFSVLPMMVSNDGRPVHIFGEQFNRSKGVDAIMILHLMKRANMMIANRSNLVEVASYMRGSYDNVYLTN